MRRNLSARLSTFTTVHPLRLRCAHFSLVQRGLSVRTCCVSLFKAAITCAASFVTEGFSNTNALNGSAET